MNLDGTYLIGRATQGRSPQRGFLALDHPTVSKRHAELLVLAGSYYLTDLGSQNGIRIEREGRTESFTKGYVGPAEQLWFGQCPVCLGDLLTGSLVRPAPE